MTTLTKLGAAMIALWVGVSGAEAEVTRTAFGDWALETGPSPTFEGEPICRAVTKADDTGTILEVQRAEGTTTVIFRKAGGEWPDLVAGFRFPLGGFGEVVFRDMLVWRTDAALLNALRAQDRAILVDPDGVPHEFSLSGSSAAIGALSRCG